MIDVDVTKSPAAFTIRFPTGGDLPPIARLFVEAFDSHPIVSLSRNLQHKFVAAHVEERAVLVAADAAGEVIGFAIGGSCEQLDRARRSFMHGNVVPLALHALRRRGTYLRIPAPNARVRRSSPLAEHELRYLAVAPAARGAGVGSALLGVLESDLLAGRPYYVWAVAHREGTLRFYERHGFREEVRSNGQVRLIKESR